MGIADEDVAAVRAASDIVGIVSQYLQLRRVGRRWTGLCPFHQERTPSFSVNGEDGLYYCFGCQASGDVITFVREVEKLDFVGAVEWLAGKAGLTLRYTDRDQGESRRRRARLVEVVQQAVAWYHERLLVAPDAGPARRYLRERGIDGDVVREYQIGWAPDAWDELCRALELGEATARDTGLGFRNSRNRLQDSFRARVMFPIRDPQGDPVSFGGRLLPGAEDPHNRGKYKNTPETPLYHKSKVLYGMDRAKSAMVASDTVVISEGYTDVIGFHRSGVPTAVATCGTSLTDEHITLLRRYARKLVLAFDADGAGQAAAERLYQWERDHDLEVFVADLPEGSDPADLAQVNPGELERAVGDAVPFMRFRLDRVFGAHDLTTPEGRGHAAEEALAMVAEHPDPFLRDQYLMDVVGRCRMAPEQLRPQLEELRRRPAARRAAAGASQAPAGRGTSGEGRRAAPVAARAGAARGGAGGSAGQAGDEPPHPAEMVAELVSNREESGGRVAGGSPGPGGAGGGSREGPAWEVLRHAVHNPGEVAPWLVHGAFPDPHHRQVLSSLVAADTLPEAVEHAAASSLPGAADLLRRLSVEEPVSQAFDAVRLLLSEVARRELEGLRYAASAADDPADALAESAFLSRSIGELRSSATAGSAADRLLAWLRQRVGDGG